MIKNRKLAGIFNESLNIVIFIIILEALFRILSESQRIKNEGTFLAKRKIKKKKVI